MIRQIYTPNFPKLMAAEGEKCGSWGKGRDGRVPTRCVRAAGHVENHLQDVDPRYLRPDWNSPAPKVVTETTFVITLPDGTKMLRGYEATPDTTEAQIVDLIQMFLPGGTTVTILGTLSGYETTTTVTEVDYAADGSKVMAATRKIGAMPASIKGICDCGKGVYCPQFGTANAQVRAALADDLTILATEA